MLEQQVENVKIGGMSTMPTKEWDKVGFGREDNLNGFMATRQMSRSDGG